MHPDFTSQISGKHFLAPDDFATIYDLQGLYGRGITGAGQSIAIVGQSDLSRDTNHGNQYDVVTFRSVSNLPPANLQVLLVPGDRDPGIVANDVDEANLDVEWSGAVAKDATLIYVNSQNALFSAMPYAVDQDLAPVISVSYGLCEAQLSSSEINTLSYGGPAGQRARADHRGFVGRQRPCRLRLHHRPQQPGEDRHPWLCGGRAGQPPYVTGMGGTEFSEGDATGATQYWSATNNGNNGSALSYIPEMVWNDTVINNFLAASGGGVSTAFQQAFVADRRRRPCRWPARCARPGLEFVSRSRWLSHLLAKQLRERLPKVRSNVDRDRRDIGGGADLCRHRDLIVQNTNDPQGNVNQYIYALAASSANVFHDITTGDNMVPCTPGSKDCPASGMIGYSAGPGYDLTTGLGSVDAAALLAAWNGPTNPDFEVSAQSQSLTINRGTPATDTLTITGLAGFAQTVNLSCSVSGELSATTCSVSPRQRRLLVQRLR